MIDYILTPLYPNYKEFKDQFFRLAEGGFCKWCEHLFNDETGIGATVIGLTGVTAVIAGYKITSMFLKLKRGVGKLLDFFSLASTEVGPLGDQTHQIQKKGTGSW